MRAQLSETAEAGLHPLVEAVLEAASDALVAVDGSGRISLMNAQTVRLFGYRRDELLSRPIEMLIPPRFRSGHAQLRTTYQSAPTTRGMGSGIILYGRRKDGSEFPAEISLGPHRSTTALLLSPSFAMSPSDNGSRMNGSSCSRVNSRRAPRLSAPLPCETRCSPRSRTI
jgi:PAS domain S-box-containing protein